MMTVLLDLNILKKCLDEANLIEKHLLYSILYNKRVNFLFSVRYIKMLEKSIQDVDLFNAMIVELSDQNRITSFNDYKSLSIQNAYLELINCNKNPFFFPLTFAMKELPILISGLRTIPIRGYENDLRNSIIIQLLKQNIYTASYQEFKSDNDIKEFFTTCFSLPSKINEVYVFDREVHAKYLTSLKGYIIRYYTLSGNGISKFDLLDYKNGLKKTLGDKLKLYSTSKRSLLHERKILIDGLLISSDNSFNNLMISEPTWEVTLNFDLTKSAKWKAKCPEFKEL